MADKEQPQEETPRDPVSVDVILGANKTKLDIMISGKIATPSDGNWKGDLLMAVWEAVGAKLKNMG